MTYQELYRWVRGQLDRFDADQLFTHATQKKVFHLSFVGPREAPDKQVRLLEGFARRRREGEPLQYLLGEWEFYGLPFKVGRGVLIPRADTETLVDVSLELLREMPAPEVLDLCSGTGCVAVAIAHRRPDAAVTALEVDGAAFEYLIKNLTLNDSPVRAERGDLRDYIHPRPLDLLVANPPYIPRDQIATLQAEVRREPGVALDGGRDGLDFYRAIVRLYREQIRAGGWMAMEVGIGQRRQVEEILRGCGFDSVDHRQDTAGIDRVVFGRRSAPIQSI